MDKHIVDITKTSTPFLTITLSSHDKLLDHHLFLSCVTLDISLFSLQCFRRGALSFEIALKERDTSRSIEAHSFNQIFYFEHLHEKLYSFPYPSCLHLIVYFGDTNHPKT